MARYIPQITFRPARVVLTNNCIEERNTQRQ
jgi:hypothetical protein